jgi:hypothetical protein
MDRDIPIPQEILDAEAPCGCGYPGWRKKHDELAELVRAHLSLLDKYRYILNLDSYTQSHYSITLLQEFIGESETALRKAVKEG